MREEESLIALGEIKGELTLLRVQIEKKTDDHEGRIKGLEKKWWSGAGAFSVLLAACGSLLYKLHVGF